MPASRSKPLYPAYIEWEESTHSSTYSSTRAEVV